MSTMTKSATLKRNNYEVVESSEPLAPCPFCGGEAWAMIAPAGYGTYGIMVKCTECYTHTLAFGFNCGMINGSSWHYETKSDAIAKATARWNGRVTA